MGVLTQKLIFAVWLISNPGICSFELVKIERGFLKDVFIVPASKCDSGKDFCKEFNAKPGNVRECQCFCEHPNTTLRFHEGSWTCVGSETTFEGELCFPKKRSYVKGNCYCLQMIDIFKDTDLRRKFLEHRNDNSGKRVTRMVVFNFKTGKITKQKDLKVNLWGHTILTRLTFWPQYIMTPSVINWNMKTRIYFQKFRDLVAKLGAYVIGQ